MSDVAGFLAARLDEDEQYAKASRPLQEAAMQMLGSDWPTGKLAGDRMLREVEAKRARLALLAEATAEMDKLLADKHAGIADQAMAVGRVRGARMAVRYDAALYSDHPDWNPDWRP